MSSRYFDYGILGAGLAGLSLADALQSRGQSVIVLDKSDIGAGASGTPGALVNPATGRKGTKSWKAEACYRAIHSNLKKIQPYASRHFYHKNGVLRPAQTQKMARKMKAQYDNTTWPEGWCIWLNEDEIRQKHPGVYCIGGGLWLPVGITVDGKRYLQAYAGWLQSNKVEIKTGCNARVECKNRKWFLQTNNNLIKCSNLIFATGVEVISNRFWKSLRLEAVKGQLALFKTKEKILFNHSVSGLGYIARLPGTDELIVGSTYEHAFEHLKPDKKGAVYLRKKLEIILPKLAEKSTLKKQWSGVRISTPNRKPVAGKHPDYNNLFLFTGLGSKGLLYSKFTAGHFAGYLINDTPLFNEINLERML